MKFLLSSLVLFLFSFTTIAQPLRELRGAWLTTFSNIDWPKRNESPQQQRESLLSILKLLKETGMNTVYMQVRSQCDAMYKSELEPWSADLTGTQGMAPAEDWDPLHFAITESHKLGMDLHAWINPYRAVANIGALPYFSPQHVARKHPEWLLSSGTLRTLDPGLPEVRQHILAVISDIVSRYDVDGIHFDDYFYPEGAFNDNASFAKHSRGISNRSDWRRDNVDLLIKETFTTIRRTKPWVKFGVSPTGIYENSPDPAKGTRTTGKQHYSELFSDTKKWINEGWVDYLAPQVYWYSLQPGSPFNVISPWWASQSADRHIYVGLAGYKVGMEKGWWSASEIPDQVRLLRSPAANGILGMSIYNTSSLVNNRLAYRDSLKKLFALPAMVPAMPWIDSTAPDRPEYVACVSTPSGNRISWTLPARIYEEFDRPRFLAIYKLNDSTIAPASSNLLTVVRTAATTEYVDQAYSENKTWYRVTLVDRLWNESEPSIAVSADSRSLPVTKKPDIPVIRQQPATPPVIAAPQAKTKPVETARTEPLPVKQVGDTVRTEIAKQQQPVSQSPRKVDTTKFTAKAVIAKNPSPVKSASGIRMQVLVTGSIEYTLFDAEGNKITWGKIRSNSNNAYVLLPSTQNLSAGNYSLELTRAGAMEIFSITVQ